MVNDTHKKTLNNRKSNHTSNHKSNHKSKNQSLKQNKHNSNKSGGALYRFNLNDTIGGMPAVDILNNTTDSDCPATGTLDLGFTNYSSAKGGYYNKQRDNKKQKASRNKLSGCSCSS